MPRERKHRPPSITKMEILLAFREWSSAMADLFSHLSTLPESVSLHDIDFTFSCPQGNRIFCNVIVDGKAVTDIAFEGRFFSATDLRMWLEKLIRPAVNNERCPEFMDIYCNGERARLLVAHSGNDTFLHECGMLVHTPTSLFAIQYKGENTVRFWGFCETSLFVTRLHSAFLEALESNEDFFNDRKRWPSHFDCTARYQLSPVERFKINLESKDIRIIQHLCENIKKEH